METLIYIILANLAISAFSLFGVFTVFFKKDRLNKFLMSLVGFSAGALMGAAFLHLLPEALENTKVTSVFYTLLVSFVTFFLIERILHWRHCHKGNCEVHTFGYLNLFGDSLHNFIDGALLAGAFAVDVKLGIAASIAVASHEIPQEIGDFGVLLYSGMSKGKALVANFVVALFSVFGGVIGYLMITQISNLLPLLLAFASGGFIYISASDLMPEIRKERDLGKSLASFSMFLAGVLFMYITSVFE